MVKEFVCDTEEYARVQGLDDAEIIAEASDNEAFLVRALANRYDVVCEKLTALEARCRELEATAEVRLDALTKAQGKVRELESALRDVLSTYCTNVPGPVTGRARALLTTAETGDKHGG